MALGHVEQGTPDEGLATEHDEDPGADLLALRDDAFDLGFGEVFFKVVLGCIAAYAT